MSYPPPRYTGDTGEVSATLRRRDHPPELRQTTGGAVHYLATGASTAGEFGLYRWDFGTGRTGPDPHFHRTISESFFVLSGVVTVYDGRHWVEANPGDYLFVPEGGLHGFKNESGREASMLILFAPGAPREEYFETLVEIGKGRQLSPAELADFYLRHDTYWR
jgi:mannose-6-phosphate isomerase-like protein (cupin superfamily)